MQTHVNPCRASSPMPVGRTCLPAAAIRHAGVKTRRRQATLFRSVLMLVMLFLTAGCASYHVKSDPRLQGPRAYKVVDTTLRRIDVGWKPASEIGANENGFAIVDDFELVSRTHHLDGTTAKSLYRATPTRHRWTDIEDVRVNAAFFGIVFCGILDPTTGSHVQLTFKDGKTRKIACAYKDERLCCVYFPPVWFFTSEWSRAHKTARAFQTIVDSLDQGNGDTPATDKPSGLNKAGAGCDVIAASADEAALVALLAEISYQETFLRHFTESVEAHKTELLKGSGPPLSVMAMEVVGYQLRDGEPAEAQETLNRLVEEGATEETAKRLISGACLIELYRTYKLKAPYVHTNYLAKLQCLPRDFVDAMNLRRRATEQGDADEQFNLGVLYAKGKGVPQDLTEAGKWFMKAAAQGCPNAQFELGGMYNNGEGVPQDFAEAMKWYMQAAAQGHANAQNNLGVMYNNGKGVPQDFAEAMRWYMKAAAQGNANAQFNLGVLYNNGKGAPQDSTEAVNWFMKAAAQGYAKAQFELGVLYADGKGVPRDVAEAVKWYMKAAAQGYADAQNNLGVMYANGKGVPRDHLEAMKWYSLSAAYGSKLAAKNRAALQGVLTEQQIAEAERRATAFKEAHCLSGPAKPD